jgi:ribonuclease D
VVRSLWEARDGVASERDVAPGRILSDAVIVEIARSNPKAGRDLRSMPALRARRFRRDLATWVDAVDQALSLADSDLPTATARSNGPPPPRSWADRDPAAAARLTACRAVVTDLAERHDLPAENLIAPDLVRRLAWEPPADPNPPTIAATLADAGARRWQVQLIANPLAEALTASGS